MTAFQYRKSSYSNAENECVEVATNIPATVAIRDSKLPVGPALNVLTGTWMTFQAALAEGAFHPTSWPA